MVGVVFTRDLANHFYRYRGLGKDSSLLTLRLSEGPRVSRPGDCDPGTVVTRTGRSGSGVVGPPPQRVVGGRTL